MVSPSQTPSQSQLPAAVTLIAGNAIVDFVTGAGSSAGDALLPLLRPFSKRLNVVVLDPAHE